MTRWRRSAGGVLAVLALAAGGCDLGPSPAPPPSVVSSVRASPATDVDVAVRFAQAAWTGDFGTAGSLAASDSPAARYLAFQRASRRVDSVNGVDPPGTNVGVTSDASTRTVTIIDSSSGSPVTHVWRNVVVADQRVVSWTGEQGQLDAALSHVAESDMASGATLTLISAYVSDAGYLSVIVELSAGHSVPGALRLVDGTFVPQRGRRAQDAEFLGADLGPGEQRVTRFGFDGAHLPGTFRVQLDRVDTQDLSVSYEIAHLTLKVT